MSPVLEATPAAAGWAGLFPEVLHRVQPSIVRVHGRGPAGAGGVVWGPEAVVTNHHVVAGARQALRVLSVDGRAHAARILDTSRRLDLALLEVPGAELVPAPIGRSARLRVGELVFAVGHPWGQPWVVTAGVVSALGTLPVPGRAGVETFIRSDVRLAPGNSGGPLLDARGQVVGLNTMVIGGDLAVAIPSDVVRQWLGEGS
ncbi:MAG TPA: trypsin-like peptidase domain-containing protein [Methylomirabilota bacterium]|nr:trypsin-like peptidase domain-containing protein [Methylomirabilota bacterium]